MKNMPNSMAKLLRFNLSVLSLLALSTVITWQSASAQEFAPEPGVKHAPLQGGVTHLEQLDPLQPELREGATYRNTNLPKDAPQEFWYQIPSWSAGMWHGETSTTVSQPSSRFGGRQQETRMTRNNESWGFQRDRNGVIWQFAKCNYSSRTDHEDSYTIAYVRSKSILKNSPREIQIKYIGTQIHVNARNNKIESSLQVESIQTYTPLGPDQRKNVASIRTFDANGNAVSTEVNTSVQIRVAPFHIRNDLKGEDMFQSFVAYLQRQNLSDLVPTARPIDGQL